MGLIDNFEDLNPKRKFIYCSCSRPLECKGQIYLLWSYTVMLQLQNITFDTVIDLSIN